MDLATRAFLNSAAIVILGSILVFLSAWFWWNKNAAVKAKDEAIKEADRIRVEQEKLMERVMELEKQQNVLGIQVMPLNAAFQALLIKQLTHYHTPVMDKLMEKLGPPNTLTPEEEVELTEALKQRTQEVNGRIDESERDAAEILPLIIKRAKKEAEIPIERMKIIMVTVERSQEEFEGLKRRVEDKE
jgi:hypothetical protein